MELIYKTMWENGYLISGTYSHTQQVEYAHK